MPSENIQFMVTVSEATYARLVSQGEHTGVTHNTQAALILTEMSRVKPEKIYEAMGGIPERLKLGATKLGIRV
jgi:hypothetical protein